MKKLAIILLVSAGLFACSGNGGQKQNKDQKQKADIAAKKSGDKVAGPRKDSFLDDPGGLVDYETAKKAYYEGEKLYNEKKYDEAIEKFKIVLKNNPNNNVALHFLGRIYHEKGDKERAISYYEKAARNNIDDSVSVLYIGQIYFEMKDMKNAMEYYNIAVDMAPHYALALYNRGTLYGMQNEYEKALEDLNRSIAIDSTNGNAYINRGLANYYLKNFDAACRDWQKAASMGFKQAQEAVDKYCKKKK